MADRAVLVLNAGSSSLKFQAVAWPSGERLARGHTERVEEGGFGPAFRDVLTSLRDAGVADRLDAVGHRVVHGGARHRRPERVDDALLASIDDLSRLAPLHNPPAAEGIRRAREWFPDLPQVAVFDTAYFTGLPDEASTYALDRELLRREEVRRYGMHGTSHAYVAQRVAEHLGRDLEDLDQVVLHLGNGASAAAIRGGRPVDTSMGLTPLEGLVMGTRGGDLDPGILIHLQRHGGLDLAGLEDLLHHRGGILGLAGSSDFRDLLAAVDAGDADARVGYAVYCRRIRKYVGAYLAVLGGADVITFTAGIGENVARVREDSLAGLDRLGIVVDPARNRSDETGPRVISTAGSAVTVMVVPTDEELAISREVAARLDW